MTRPRPSSTGGCGSSGRHDLPAAAAAAGDPGAEPVDHQRERVPRRLGPAVRDDPSLDDDAAGSASSGRSRASSARFEREAVSWNADALAPRGYSGEEAAVHDRRSSARLRSRVARASFRTAPTTGRSPASKSWIEVREGPGRRRRSVAACQRTRRIASSAVVQNVARKTSSGPTASVVSVPDRRRDDDPRRRSLVVGVGEHEAVQASRPATLRDRREAHEPATRELAASASKRSSAVLAPPKTRRGLRVGIRRFSRGPSPALTDRALTRRSSATPSIPGVGGASRFAGPAEGPGSRPGRPGRGRSAAPSDGRPNGWRARSQSTGRHLRSRRPRRYPPGMASWRRPPATSRSARRRCRRPDARRRRHPVPTRSSGAPTFPAACALRQGGSAANTARWLARLGAQVDAHHGRRARPGRAGARRCGARPMA